MTASVTVTRRAALGVAAGAAATLAAPHYARAQSVEITVHYAQPQIFKESKDAVAAAFARLEPGIRINWVTTPDYEAGTQLVLRQAATNQLPDVSYQGLNRQRVLAERGIAVDLAPFIARDGGAAALGYSPPILAQGTWAGIQAGLPYAMSNPITYVNNDLLKRIGVDIDRMPTDWDGHAQVAQRLRGIGDGVDPWYIDFGGGEWMWSSWLFSYGGRFLTPDERTVAFNGPEGIAAMRELDRMVKTGKPNMTGAAAQQSFGAGKLALHYRSTALLRNMIQSVGRNFELRTLPFPTVSGGRVTLPVGGSAGMIMTRDPAKQEAAWKFIRFSTSAEGTTLMVVNTGYVPCNQIAIDDPRWLGNFYRENPLFQTATRQVAVSVPWYAFPGGQGVRISQIFGNGLSRIMEQRATPEQVIADLGQEVQRLLPRQG
jgi:multiple sugar transport system substrate-binding protein